MLKSKILNFYIFKEFIRLSTNVTLVFTGLILVLNMFDEINFFKESNVDFYFPIFMSLMKLPSILYKVFPFIFLISSIFLFLKIIQSDEIITIKISGISNFKIIFFPVIISFFLGSIIVLGFNPFASMFSHKYYEIKNTFTEDNEYLASITNNGIWIKDNISGKTNIVKANKLIDDKLIEVSIYQFDKDKQPVIRLEAEEANIKNYLWKLKNTKIFTSDLNNEFDLVNDYTFVSNIDLSRLKNIFSNFESVSFWDLKEVKKNYEVLGYSTEEIISEFHRCLSYPFYIMAMTFIAGIIMTNIGYRKGVVFPGFLGILLSVVIYYLNDLSQVMGQTGIISTVQSIWVPTTIILLISVMGSLHVNEK